MSCFIVSDKSINAIVNALELNPLFRWNRDKIIHAAGLAPCCVDEKTFQLLAEKLLQMNYEAFDARYNDKTKDGEISIERNYSVDGSNVYLYKTLQSYLYQCSEGDVNKSELFKALTEFMAFVASEVIGKLDEYKQVPWREE